MKGQCTIDVQRRWGNTYTVNGALSGVWTDFNCHLTASWDPEQLQTRHYMFALKRTNTMVARKGTNKNATEVVYMYIPWGNAVSKPFQVLVSILRKQVQR